jgi:hypothetical protein
VAGLDYAPFNLNFTLWSSTSWKFTNTFAYTLSNTGIMSVGDKTGAAGQRLAVRTFTVTGTTLT